VRLVSSPAYVLCEERNKRDAGSSASDVSARMHQRGERMIERNIKKEKSFLPWYDVHQPHLVPRSRHLFRHPRCQLLRSRSRVHTNNVHSRRHRRRRRYRRLHFPHVASTLTLFTLAFFTRALLRRFRHSFRLRSVGPTAVLVLSVVK